jgi:transcriptional regulator with XRE-family HTH domain
VIISLDMSHKYASLGPALRAYRQALDMSQSASARAIGVPEGTLSRWENDVSFPNGDGLRAIAQGLRCRITVDNDGVELVSHDSR